MALRISLTSHSCSIFATLITVITGIYTIHSQAFVHDNNFSSISRTMQGPDIAALFTAKSGLNAAAHKKKIAATVVKLIETRERNEEQFHVTGERHFLT